LLGVGILQALAPGGWADDETPKKKTASQETKPADKGEKTEGVKKSQTTPYAKRAGVITKMAADGKSFTLEVPSGRKKESLEVLIAEDATIRLPRELQFDEKGKPKPSKKDGLPGMPGGVDDLRENQMVQVSLGKSKDKKLVATYIIVQGELKTAKKK
jgi:hypothetical protein